MIKKSFGYFSMIFAASLLAANLTLAAQPANLQESLQIIQDSVQEVQAGTKNLVDAKDQEETLNAEEQQTQLKLRLEVFAKVIKLSIKECEDVIGQLESLDALDGKNAFFRDRLADKFKNFLRFYNQEKEKYENYENINLAEIKNAALVFKQWRDAVYRPIFQNATDFLLINRQSSTLSMADIRYQKIASDLKKLKKFNFANSAKLEKLLNQTLGLLGEAKKLEQEAENRFWSLIIINPTASSTQDSVALATSTTASTTAAVTIINIELNAEPETPTAASSTASSTAAVPPSTLNENQIVSIKNLVGESLNKIKETYQVFIEMSNIVKKLLI